MREKACNEVRQFLSINKDIEALRTKKDSQEKMVIYDLNIKYSIQ